MNSTLAPRWRTGLVVAGLFVAAFLAGATRRGAATPTAVGVVNIKALFEGLTEYKENFALIEDQRKTSAASVKEAEADAKKLSDDFELLKDPPMAVRVAFRVKLFEAQAKYDARVSALSRALDVQLGELRRRVYLKAIKTCESLAKKDGWDVVLIDDRHIVPPERMQTEAVKEGPRIGIKEVNTYIQERTIFYADDTRVDITPSLVAMMNNEFKAGAR